MGPDQDSAAGGNPTRLPLRSSADTTGDVSRVLGKLEAGGNDLPVNRMMANSAGAFRPIVLLSDALMNRISVSPFIRETVILHLAARLGVRYEWGEHITMSEDAGISDAMRDALAAPASGDLSALTAEQQAAVRLSDQILARTLTDEGWEEACSLWGAETVLELVLCVGFWGGLIPTVLGAFGERHGLVARGRGNRQVAAPAP